MSAPILFTKLFIPPSRLNSVLRPRLIERLGAGLAAGSKLTLISAPAGFGKTTLVSAWAAGCGRPVAWVSLDEADRDPARFLTYLTAALQTIAADIGKGVLEAIQSSQSRTTVPEALLATLLNEITTIPNPFILVLDDYHLIDCESIDQVLTFLLDHQPAQMHLVVATREDPSLPLPRYRVRGQLTEMRAADLRFTPEEAAIFLNQVMGLNLPAESIAALGARTEGWIAGLQLAALSMQGREDIDGFIQAFAGSHRFVLDYLVEEVLQRQPQQVRSFLLQTAVLDRFCAPLCNAVTGREDGREMLEALDRSNLFLIPLDDRRQWYRYHHLFSDVLQTHLIEAQPDRVTALHLRASVWYERSGFQPDAIRHTLAANDLERAAGLIELAWPAAEAGSIQPAAWLGWVKALPDELVRTRPVLTVWVAYALLGMGELEAAEARFKDAERWVELADPSNAGVERSSGETRPDGTQRMIVTDQDQFQSLPATIAVGRSYIAQAFGRTADTIRYARRVLELLPEGDSFRHSQASMLLGMACWASGDLEAASRVFADYTVKLWKAGNLPDAISTTAVLAELELALGHLSEAIRTTEQLLQFVMDRGEPIPPDTADLHRELSELYLDQGNLEAAAEHLRRSKELGEKAELPVWRYRQCIAQARLDQTLGDLDGSLAFLDEAERQYIRTPLPDPHPISAQKVRIWVAQGRLAQALEWVREQGLSPDDDINYLREFEYLTLARILIAQDQKDRMEGSFHAALRLLDRLSQAAEEGRRTGSMIEILMLQARTHQAQGSLPDALVPLERALTLAEPEGYSRVFVDEGEPVRLLIADCRMRIEKRKRDQDQKLIGYTDKLLAAFMQQIVEPQSTTRLEKPAILAPAAHLPSRKDIGTMRTQAPGSAGVRNPQSEMVEPLSQRELEVLRLLRTELSGPEIARELVVSLNTVRTHTQNIYAKLEVNSRRAAVRRAEELKIL